MRVKLTDRSVHSLEPKDGKQTEFFDQDNSNFSLRVSPKGRKVFYAFYRVGRRLRRHSLGTYPSTSLADARAAARNVIHQAEHGKDPATEKKAHREAETFDEIAKGFIEKYSRPNKRSAAEDERIINVNLTPTLGSTRAKDITRRQVREMLEDIAQGRLPGQDGPAPIMANRVLALTRKIFNWAISKDLLETNPCHALGILGEEQTRDRVLTDEEIKRVWIAMGEESLRMGSLFKLRLLTAQRGGEVAWMRWRDIEWDAKVWAIPAEFSKNGNLHRVPLSDLAIKILRVVEADAERESARRKKEAKSEADREAAEISTWVFPGRKRGQSLTELQKCIQRLREASKVEFRGHDLRRTAASKMTELGVPRLIVKKILNHADTEITAVYDRFAYDKEKREALELWAKRVAVVTSGLQVVKGQQA